MDIVSGQLVSDLSLGSSRSWTFDVFRTVLDVNLVANQLDSVVEKLIFERWEKTGLAELSGLYNFCWLS